MTLEEAFNQVPGHLDVGVFRHEGKFQAVIAISTKPFSGPLAVVDGSAPAKALDEAWQKAKAKLDQ